MKYFEAIIPKSEKKLFGINESFQISGDAEVKRLQLKGLTFLVAAKGQELKWDEKKNMDADYVVGLALTSLGLDVVDLDEKDLNSIKHMWQNLGI